MKCFFAPSLHHSVTPCLGVSLPELFSVLRFFSLAVMMRLYQNLVRWGFRRLYHELAFGYDQIAAIVSAGYWRAWALAVLPYLRAPVLELGCGTGHLQLALADQAAVGVDRSAEMLRGARRRLTSAQIALRLTRADAQALPCVDAAFQTVVATFPSEYIATPQTLAEVRRVLRPGGRVVIVLGARLSGHGYARLVEFVYRLALMRPAALTTNVVTSHPLSRALEQAGFRQEARWETAPGGHVLIVRAEPL